MLPFSAIQQQTVPYHNTSDDTYFFGNNTVAASGRPDGTWSFLIGPDYTSPNYIAAEALSVICAEKSLTFDLRMKRVRGTGIFCGSATNGTVRLEVCDFAPPATQTVVRYIRATDTARRPLTVCATIRPFEAESFSVDGGVEMVKDTTRYCFGNRETVNWAERRCRITFDGNSHATPRGDDWVLCVQPQEDGTCVLLHDCAYGEPTVQTAAAEELFRSTLTFWQEWMRSGVLPPVSDPREADVLESLLLCVKMQQNRDGGVIAGIRKYANSYIRDTHGCMRLLLATHHYDEVARLLTNIHTRWEIAGFIPNWWSMGSDIFIGHSFHNDASEVTAYYLFMARDYLAATHDRALIDRILPSLTWAAHAQRDWLLDHDLTLDFNGDETEQYCCNADNEEYGGFTHPDYPWHNQALSFPSMAAALCSLRWYADWTGEDLSELLTNLAVRIDEIFLSNETGVHSWSATPLDGGWQHHRGQLTNFLLLPLWFGANLRHDGEKTDAAAVKAFVRADGFLPNCPEIMPGFCGHTMALYLYDMLKLGDAAAAHKAVRTILDTPLLSMYGTVSEFYGPSCTPNGHNCRGFEGGILGEALIRYYEYESTR